MSPRRHPAPVPAAGPAPLGESASRRVLCAAAYLCLADVNRRVAAAKLNGDIGIVAGAVTEIMTYNRLVLAFSDERAQDAPTGAAGARP